MRKERLNIHSEKVVKFYNSRVEFIKKLNCTDLSLLINQLNIIKYMLEGSIGKEKKDIRVNYLYQCLEWFDKIKDCEFTSTIKFVGKVDICRVLNNKRIFKKDLENLYLLVRVYILTIAKYNDIRN